MVKNLSDGPAENDLGLSPLDHLLNFKGHSGAFWPQYLEFVTHQVQASTTLLFRQKLPAGKWIPLLAWPQSNQNKLFSEPFLSMLCKFTACAAKDRSLVSFKSVSEADHSLSSSLIGLRLQPTEEENYICVFVSDKFPQELPKENARHISLLAHIPTAYFRSRKLRKVQAETRHVATALDLMSLLNNEQQYMAAVMIFCNQISSSYSSTRVSLGWLERGYIRLQAVSHMERFEKKMDIIQALEAAMEEAFDQNEEILLPSPESNNAIIRDHEIFSKVQGSQYIVSLPVRLNGTPTAVLTCEREEQPFSETEIWGLRLSCDQAARRLYDLKEGDKWIGARLADSFQKMAGKIVGIEHTFAKCLTLLICIIVVFLFLGTLPYHIEAPFILKSDDVKYLTAPFEGYVEDVHVASGEGVKEDDLLLTLDTKTLLLEESAAIANHLRFGREAEKARAENALAEMKIALALADQAQAKLDLIRYHINQAEIRAPFQGIIVEGELEELLGVPVKKGDVLFKISRVEKMHAELEFHERDIHEISPGNIVEVAFVSQPQLKYQATVYRIDPIAIAKSEGNIFLVHCTLDEEQAAWWRPGMSGVAKVDLGKKNALWVLTHRTVDFFRILLWW